MEKIVVNFDNVDNSTGRLEIVLFAGNQLKTGNPFYRNCWWNKVKYLYFYTKKTIHLKILELYFIVTSGLGESKSTCIRGQRFKVGITRGQI